MIKKMMMSFFVCLLIPTCIFVYMMLFKDLQEKGMLSFQQKETAVVEREVSASAEEENDLSNAENPIELDDAFPESTPLVDVIEEDVEVEELLDYIDYEYEANQQEIEQITHEDTEEGILVHFVTKNENGDMVDERYEVLNNEQIIQQNSDRHLEILAEEFVRMHFEYEGHDVFYTGEMVSRDEQYAKVSVIKTEWKANFYKEKYNVILDVSGSQAKPISMQQVNL